MDIKNNEVKKPIWKRWWFWLGLIIILIIILTLDFSTDNSGNLVNQLTKEQCKSKGGIWGIIGLSKEEKCNLPTSDSGKICSDSEECKGSCIAEVSEKEYKSLRGGDSKIQRKGKCSEYEINVGCLPFVNKGSIHMICVD
jgi:hypothetical protein